MRTTLKDSPVIFVDGEGKLKPGFIQEVFSPGAARIDLTPRTAKGEAANEKEPLGSTTAQATYSTGGEPGTFHYTDESDAAKKSIAARKKGETEPAAPTLAGEAGTSAASNGTSNRNPK